MQSMPCQVAAIGVMMLVPLAAAAQRPMTRADVRPPAFEPPSWLATGAAGERLEASLLSEGSRSALSTLLARANPKLLAGRSGGEVASDAEALERDVARGLLPQERALRDALMTAEPDAEVPPPGGPSRHGPSASGDPARYRPRRADLQTFTSFYERERVVRMSEGGLVTNVRMEMTVLREGRRVGWRIVSRTTVEMNPALRSDQPAVEQAVVEAGTEFPETAQRKVDQSSPRRLRPTSEFRMTTTAVREAKVDRCPDAGGLSRGVFTVSMTIRATAAASGTGAPVTMETGARGSLVGHVDGGAKLAGYDVEAKLDHRMEAIGSGQDFRTRSTFAIGLRDGRVTGTTPGTATAEGKGSVEDGIAAGELMNAAFTDALGPSLQAFDMAQDWWRRPGNCYELTAVAGAAPERIRPGERRRVVVGARHKEDPSPPAVPVTAKASAGALNPGTASTPQAGFDYVHPARGAKTSTLTFSSISRRGIAPDLTISFSEGKAESIPVRVTYIGYKFVESTPEDCPDMRPGGRQVLSATLRLVSFRPGEVVYYEGPGRLSADIDGCGLTPNREDPGMVHDRGDPPGDFHGDNFLGCKVTTVVPEHAVRVRLSVSMVDPRQPNAIQIEWEPMGSPARVTVSTGCEPAYEAQYVTDLTREYRRRGSREITDYDLLPRMAPGGKLREGVYRSAEDEGLTVTVGEEIEIPSLVGD